MKKKVWRAKHKQDSTAITAEKAIELIDKAMDMLKQDVVVVPEQVANEIVTEIVEEAKPKKRASKKKEA